jgi:predicted AlkP superfamily pyrophosphatase or phosphodiesterase
MKKIQLRKNSSTDRVTRAISINSELQLNVSSKEENQTGLFTYHPNYDSHKEVMNALLEAEKHKAMAIMYYQRRSLAH